MIIAGWNDVDDDDGGAGNKPFFPFSLWEDGREKEEGGGGGLRGVWQSPNPHHSFFPQSPLSVPQMPSTSFHPFLFSPLTNNDENLFQKATLKISGL